jgi:deazaflavin-dependent oxidoreductase (nitroreductase family)
MAGTRLLVLTTTGAKTGQSRRVLLFFSKDGADYVIAGTASGSTRDPAWLHNLEAKADGLGRSRRPAVRGVSRGRRRPERERLWHQHLEAQPQLAAHAEQAGRTIPMVRLTPR